MNQQAQSSAAAVPVTARSNGLSLVFGLGAYVAMIPFVFAASCIALLTF